MIQGVSALFLFIVEDYRLLLIHLTLKEVPKLWRLIQVDLNRDPEEPTHQYQISVTTHYFKSCLLRFQLEFRLVYLFRIVTLIGD
ncbi:hypothetical protein Golob_018814 [Gossypium lobatum]|uniref:Uncharacterized protein n=1 Tax=Gossypium lobatum TaxID=34289 RepID=A0A7J8L5F8_9ROSI|nr:hypothetical protein [Gossypium lobatum]